MGTARILAYVILFFYLLASVNGFKKYTSLSFVKKLATFHRMFGVLAGTTAIIFLIYIISISHFTILGLLMVIFVLGTGFFGMLFKTTKKKSIYITHRIVGPLAFVFILLYLIF